MVIAKTVPAKNAPKDVLVLGRLYFPRQHPRIRHIAYGLCRNCEDTPVGETMELLRHDGRSVIARGVCTYCHCTRSETHMILREQEKGRPDRYVHVTMHSNEIMTAVRTGEDVEFVHSENQNYYPPGPVINCSTLPSA